MTNSPSLRVTIGPSDLPEQTANDLFVQWCLHLAKKDLHVDQWGSRGLPLGPFRFGPEDGHHFEIARTDARTWQVTEHADIDISKLATLLQRAASRVEASDTGEDVAYRTVLASSGLSTSDSNFGLHLVRMMGDNESILGSRRIGDRVLLDFRKSSDLKEAIPFGVRFEITATIFVPGPTDYFLADRIASSVTEIVAAICAHALGHPVSNHMPLPPSTLDESGTAQENVRRHDAKIQGLKKGSVDLDIFGSLFAIGGVDAMIRARNALITLHEAQRQANADVATMLYVGAIEALISPPVQVEWRKEQVAKRFREGVLALCLDTVDALLARGDIESALNFKKQGRQKWQRRQLVDHIYDLRSIPTHTGATPSQVGIMQLTSGQATKISILSELAIAALHGYMRAPRSFLVGHPGMEAEKKRALEEATNSEK